MKKLILVLTAVMFWSVNSMEMMAGPIPQTQPGSVFSANSGSKGAPGTAKAPKGTSPGAALQQQTMILKTNISQMQAQLTQLKKSPPTKTSQSQMAALQASIKTSTATLQADEKQLQSKSNGVPRAGGSQPSNTGSQPSAPAGELVTGGSKPDQNSTSQSGSQSSKTKMSNAP